MTTTYVDDDAQQHLTTCINARRRHT